MREILCIKAVRYDIENIKNIETMNVMELNHFLWIITSQKSIYSFFTRITGPWNGRILIFIMYVVMNR